MSHSDSAATQGMPAEESKTSTAPTLYITNSMKGVRNPVSTVPASIPPLSRAKWPYFLMIVVINREERERISTRATEAAQVGEGVREADNKMCAENRPPFMGSSYF